jgi:MOSC domain-containing protein YiiM
MEIVSTNIGESVTIEWLGQQVQTGIFKFKVDTPISLGFEDVGGDHVLDRRYHGGIDKACYLYSAAHYPFWQNKYPNLDWNWGMFGENLTITEMDESTIRIGDKFKIGEALVQVSQPRQPCFKLGLRFGDQSVVGEFWNSPFPGVYMRVLQSGNVKKGDKLILTDTNKDSLSVREVFSIFSQNRSNTELIRKAMNEPFLAESCRNDLKKILMAIGEI